MIITKKLLDITQYITELFNEVSINLGYADAPFFDQVGFQDPATPIMEGIIDLHHDLAFFLILISIFVSWMLFIIILQFNWKGRQQVLPLHFKIGLKMNRYTVQDMFKAHHTAIEVIWTIVPSVILMLIALPSFALLYAMDEVLVPEVTVKAIGHQWFWSYEYSDSNVLIYNDRETGKELGRLKYKLLHYFDSYMITENDLTYVTMFNLEPEEMAKLTAEDFAYKQQTRFLRLLEVDNRVVLPLREKVRFLVTSTDVLHSWAVPSLGVKIDACPGRLNQTSMYIKREGIFYGQCSEICGVNHAFMPIVVIAVAHWVSKTGIIEWASLGAPGQYWIPVNHPNFTRAEIEWRVSAHWFTQWHAASTYHKWLHENGTAFDFRLYKNKTAAASGSEE